MVSAKRSLVIFGTAIASVVVALLVLNLTLGNEPIDTRLKIDYAIDDPQFLRTAGSVLSPSLVQGNRIRALVNGEEIVPAMLAAIRGARRTITLETYIYWSGSIGSEFARALSERAQSGVKVHPS